MIKVSDGDLVMLATTRETSKDCRDAERDGLRWLP
jgi:hypothetical protein